VTVWVTEFITPFSGQRGPVALPPTPPINTQAGSTTAGAVSTFALSTRTALVRVQADAVAYLGFTSSTSAVNPTSTTGVRVSANQKGEYFSVCSGSRIAALST
jgi:hypothetical protein